MISSKLRLCLQLAISVAFVRNISGRMADQLREAIEERGTVGEEDGEIVMAELVAGVRYLAQSAEILLIESLEP